MKNSILNRRLVCLAVFYICVVSAAAQTITVSGTVSSATRPVQNASVTFIDSNNLSGDYSAQTDANGHYSINLTTSVLANGTPPAGFFLAQNYPNPFSGSTAISFALDAPAQIMLTIHDVLGRQVRHISLGIKPAGAFDVSWDGTSDSGERVATGVYLCRLQAGARSQVRKMIFAANANALLHPGDSQALQKSSGEKNLATFVVRITNTATTFPTIVPKRITNVSIETSTIMNFAVDEYVNMTAATILPDSNLQVISGFGAANILQWRPDMKTDEINRAFGTGDGQVGLTILRLRVPSDVNGFSVNVPTARAAAAMGAKIIASPWSPPAGMKTNNNIVGGRLKDTSYGEYAAYLKSFADYMSKQGVPLYAISIQNEPDVTVTYESCDWTADEIKKFVKENAQNVGTRIIAPESFNFNPNLSDPILNDATAASHVDIIGGHIYGGGLVPYPLAAKKGKELWMTEHLDTDTTWTNVLATGKEISDCMNAGMNAYIWWYIVRFYGPIREDSKVSKRGFVMSQFARFIRPGFYRVSATAAPQNQVYISAYRDGGKVIMVAVNQNSQSVQQTFILKGRDAVRFAPYVTTKSENVARLADVIAARGEFSTTLTASSVTTFVSQ
jgi:glucuronoarabinoxylan endo-1,4-beta-xylanase